MSSLALKTDGRKAGKKQLRKMNGRVKATGKGKKTETLKRVKARFEANREAMLKRAAVNGVALFGKTDI